LQNLGDLKLKIDKNEVLQYYYMRNIYNTQNWLFTDYDTMLTELGGYDAQFDDRVYDYLITKLTDKRHNEIIQCLKSFWYSNDFRLNKKHFLKSIITTTE